MNLHANFKEHCKWIKKQLLDFGGNLRYRLRPETISPLFADLSCTTHIKIVLRDSSLYPKQLPLFCLLSLVNASTDPIGYISNFYGMIKPLHELKNRGF